MELSCASCGHRIEDVAEAVRRWGEVHEACDPYLHFKPDTSDPTGYRGFYYPMDHPAAPAQAA